MSPWSTCWRNVPNDVAGAWSVRWISLDAKKASTITIRIGNAALLKNRLMRRGAASAQMWYGWGRGSKLPVGGGGGGGGGPVSFWFPTGESRISLQGPPAATRAPRGGGGSAPPGP